MDPQAQLLSEILDFLSTRNIAATTFGRKAVNDGKFVERLKGGANMTLATIKRARAFMERTNADAPGSTPEPERGT